MSHRTVISAFLPILSLVTMPIPAPAQCVGEWAAGMGIPGVHGRINAMTKWDPDGDGPQSEVIVLVGRFQFAGESPAESIAIWDGESLSAFPAGIRGFASDEINAVTVFNGDLVVGGKFSQIGGVQANYIAIWNGTAWEPLGIGMDRPVHALAVYGDHLIAGGDFDMAGGEWCLKIARWNGKFWHRMATGTGSGHGMTGGSVYALAVFNGELIAAGNFWFVNSLGVDRIARWDGTIWRTLGTGGPSSTVNALHVRGNDLFVGGAFLNVNGSYAGRIIRWDGSAWHTLGAGMDQEVTGLSEMNGDIVAMGKFTIAGETPATRIARWDGGTWHAMGNGISHHVDQASIEVNAAIQFQGKLLVGGNYGLAGTTRARSIANWDGTDWQLVANGNGLDGPVAAMTVYEGDLIAAGTFTRAGTEVTSNIARWDGNSWHALGEGLNGRGNALAVVNGELFAGCEYGYPSTIWKWDGTSWIPLESPYTGPVRALFEFDGHLIVAGWLQSPGRPYDTYVLSWDGASWQALGGVFSPYLWNDSIAALAEFNHELIAAGSFGLVNGLPISNMARWDGVSWLSMCPTPEVTSRPVAFHYVPDWETTGCAPLSQGLKVLTTYRGELIAGGYFYVLSRPEISMIARWDGTLWKPLGLGTDNAVNALLVHDDKLLVAGAFQFAGETPAQRLAMWDGSTWHAFSQVPNNTVRAMVHYNHEVILGGDFTAIGETGSAYLARVQLSCAD